MSKFSLDQTHLYGVIATPDKQWKNQVNQVETNNMKSDEDPSNLNFPQLSEFGQQTLNSSHRLSLLETPITDSVHIFVPDTGNYFAGQETERFATTSEIPPKNISSALFGNLNLNLKLSHETSFEPSLPAITSIKPVIYQEQFRHLSTSPPFFLKHGKQLFRKIADMIGILLPKDDRDNPSLADVCSVIEDFESRKEGGTEETGFALSLILNQAILYNEFVYMPNFHLHAEEMDVKRALLLHSSWRAQQNSFMSSVYAATCNKALSNALCASLTSLEEESSIAFEANKGFSVSCLNSLTSIMLDCFQGSKYHFISLAVVGSSGNALSLLDSSDLDLTLLVDDSSSQSSDTKSVAIEILTIVMDSISQQPGLFVVKELVNNAKVPVLKLLRDSRDIDISVNQVNGICNTALLRRYTEVDSRVRSVVLGVKLWAKRRGVNNPRNSTLSSYAWTILVIHFLQNIQPPVVPILQVTPEINELLHSDYSDLGYVNACLSDTDIILPVEWKSSNVLSNGELFILFFKYFSSVPTVGDNMTDLSQHFDIFRHICSINEIGVQFKHPRNVAVDCKQSFLGDEDEKNQSKDVDHNMLTDESQASQANSIIWRICIEDPIDRSIDLGRVIYRVEGQLLIIDEIRRALFLLQSRKIEALSSCGPAECIPVLEELSCQNTQIPSIPFLCSNCGSDQHASSECTELICNHCKGYGHVARNCTAPSTCYKCGGPHRVKECPTKANSQKKWSDVVITGNNVRIRDGEKFAIASDKKDFDLSEQLRNEFSIEDAIEATREQEEGRSGNGYAFIQEVLTWQTKQISNNLYLKDRLTPIPLVFESPEEWYGTFYPFILEECRAHLNQLVDKSFIGLQKFKVNIFMSPGTYSSLEFVNDALLTIFVIFPREVDEKYLTGTAKFSLNLFVKNGPPEDSFMSAEKLKSLTHCLANLRYTVYPRKVNERPPSKFEKELMDAHPGCVIFTGETLASSPICEDFRTRRHNLLTTGWEIMVLGVGSIAWTRLCDALHHARGPPTLMPDIVSGSSTIADTISAMKSNAAKTNMMDIVEHIHTYCSSLNESQKGAVYKVLQVAVGPDNVGWEFGGGGYDQPACLQIIKGPPGTGKTATLVALLRSLVECGLKVHASAPTNVAVCELARRVLVATEVIGPSKASNADTYDTSDNYEEGETRDDSEINGDPVVTSRKLRLADFLLVGDAVRLKIEEDPENSLHEILLDARAKRIEDNFVDLSMNISNFLAAVRMKRTFKEEQSLPDTETYEKLDLSRGKSLKMTLSKLYYQLDIMINEAPLSMVGGLRKRSVKDSLLRLLFTVCEFPDEIFELWIQHESTALQLQYDQLTLQCQQISSRKSNKKSSQANAESAELRQTSFNYAAALRLDRSVKELSALINQLSMKPLPKNLKEILMKQASIVFSTVNVSGRAEFFGSYFDVAVVDEATQLVQAEIAIVLRRHSLRCLVLAGDDKQLPATVISLHCRSLGYEMSLFSRLLHLEYPYSLLNIQYRMHPEISRWPKIEFYDGNVEDGENVYSEKYSKDWHQFIPPYCVYDINVGFEESDHLGSKYNETQATLVRKLLFQIRSFNSRISVGIISPYAAQVNLLKHLETPSHSAKSPSDSGSTEVSVRVCTVDGFQGQECDIIILTSVRSNDKSNIGFLRDERRLNVAATRARYSFILICNAHTVSTANTTWQRLIDNSLLRQVLFDSSSNKVIADTSKKMQRAEDRFKLFQDDSKSELFENSPWKVIFSNDFQKSTAKFSSMGNVLTLLKKGLIRLVQGEWPKYIIQSSIVSLQYRDVIHVYKVLQYYLVWSVDVNHSTFLQYIRIWNFVVESELPVAVARVETVLKTYSTEYIKRCSEKHHSQQNIVHPKSWQVVDNFGWKEASASSSNNRNRNRQEPVSSDGGAVDVVDSVSVKENRQVSDAAVLTKFYDLTSSVVKLLMSERRDDGVGTIELPFVMSAQENKIVRDLKSMIILGRSGTGKTTVILHRMYLQDLEYRRSTSEEGFNIDSNSVNAIRDLHMNIQGQLLVTSSPILCQAIRKSYNNMQRAARILEGKQNADADATSSAGDGMININNQISFSLAAASVGEEVDGSRIDSFASCSDSQYPLIITYSKFLFMLDKTLQSDSYFVKFNSANCPVREVNFDRFCSFYFPHFDELKLVGDASLIFTEIMSHIKGSLQSLRTAKGFLSREEYLKLAEKRDSALSRPERTKIYDLFERYEKIKAIDCMGDFDQIDVIFHVYKTLKRSPHLFQDQYLVRNVYVDEVQDLVPAQIALFKFVCKNLKGFLFAGDTAQTIAHGVGFRFESLKDIFYYEFLGQRDSDEHVASYHTEYMPNIWQLSENFRTHCGVVNLANSIVELIIELFPSSIDRLAPETSSIEGDGHVPCEFGAEQVILVRDEKAKQEVVKISGDRALVLTVLEAKGMEFNDCLVYNFFDSSPLGKDWRTLYGIVDPSIPHPVFSPQQHSQLCVELKLLYVLLTRARQHLIIFDENISLREPMLRYWLKNDLVVQKPLDETIRSMFLTPTSSPEEWQQQGIQFLHRKQFWNAKLCFQRARDEFNLHLCEAMEMEHEADKLSAQSFQKAKEMYMKAATTYLSLFDGFKVNAAGCYEKATSFRLAANLYSEILQHQNAARCYEKIEMWGKAMLEYSALSDVSNTVRCGYNGLEYSLLIVHLDLLYAAGAIATEHEHDQLIQESAKKAAIHYHTAGDVPKMVEFVLKFSTANEKRRFLRRYQHLDQLLNIEISEKRYVEAGQICWDMRNFEQAQHWYELAGRGIEAARCILQIVKASHLDSRFMVLHLSPQNLALLEKGMDLISNCSHDNKDKASKDTPEFYLRVEIEMVLRVCKGQSLDMLIEQVQHKRSQAPMGDALRLLLMLMRYKIQQIEPLFNGHTVAVVSNAITQTSKRSSRTSSKTSVSQAPPETVPLVDVEKLSMLKKSFYVYQKLLLDDFLPPLESMVRTTSTPVNTFRSTISSIGIQRNAKTSELPTSGKRASESSAYVSSSTISSKLQQCLAVFELFYVDQTSSFISPTRVVMGSAHSPNMGLISTFKLRVTERNEVKATVQEVAQLGVKFFREELSKLVNILIGHLEKRFQSFPPIDSFGDRANRMLTPISARTVVASRARERIAVLCDIYELKSLESTDKNIFVGAIKSTVALPELAQSLCDILSPQFLFPEHSAELQQLRYDVFGAGAGPGTAARNIISEYLSKSVLSKVGTDCESIGRALLYAQLVDDINSAATRVEKVLRTEYNISPWRPNLEEDARIQLTKAFHWEGTNDNRSDLKLTWPHGSFLLSLMTGFQSLISARILDRITTTLNLSLKTIKGGILSPATFMKLSEKYFVLMLLHSDRYRMVKMPLSLVRECLCRRNKAYADVIRRYQLPKYNKCDKEQSDIFWKCKHELHRFTQMLLKIIETISVPMFEHWVQISRCRIQLSSSSSSSIDELKHLRNAFFSQASMIIVTYVVNLPAKDKLRSQYCSRLSAAALSKVDNSSMRQLPLYVNSFLSKLTDKNALVDFHEFSKFKNQDEVVILSCVNSSFVEPTTSYLNRQLIIDLEGDRVVLVPRQAKAAKTIFQAKAAKATELTTVAVSTVVTSNNDEADDGEDEPIPLLPGTTPTDFDSSLVTSITPWEGTKSLAERVEDRVQQFNAVLRVKAAKVKEVVGKFTATDSMLRLVEKEFLSAGFRCRLSPVVDILHSTLTPQFLLMQTLTSELEELTASLTDAANKKPPRRKLAEIHENIDLALDSGSILDAAMELLVPANYIHALTQQLSSKAERFSNQTDGSAEHTAPGGDRDSEGKGDNIEFGMSALVLASQQSGSGGDAEMIYTTVSPDITATSIAHPLALQRGLQSIGEEGDTAYDSKLPADSSIASVSPADSSSRLGPSGEHRLFLPDDDHEFFTAFAENLKRSVDESLQGFNETIVKKHKAFSEIFAQYFG
eukprot:gene23772-32158_t